MKFLKMLKNSMYPVSKKGEGSLSLCRCEQLNQRNRLLGRRVCRDHELNPKEEYIYE